MRVVARLPIAFLLACTASTSPELQFDRRTRTARLVVAELPPMDGIANLWPTSINSHGDVVGIDLTGPIARRRAFFYDARSGRTRRLMADATSSQTATAINDSRQIVGWVIADGAPQGRRAVRWDAGTVSDLAAL